jgi:hypothetical protein
MNTYTHKLTGQTYSPIKNITDGVLFSILETGEEKELSSNQIRFLLK